MKPINTTVENKIKLIINKNANTRFEVAQNTIRLQGLVPRT